MTAMRGLYLEGRIHGEAYFRNFTVAQNHLNIALLNVF